MREFNNSRRRGFSIVEALVVFAIATTSVATTLPALMQAREAARRSTCKNNLKQIGLALHTYHDIHRTFPPGWTNSSWEPTDTPRFGWTASLLPMLEEAQLFKRIDYEKPMPAPDAVTVTALRFLQCPSDVPPNPNPLRGNYGVSNYAGNFGSAPFPRWRQGRLSRSWLGRLATPNIGQVRVRYRNGIFRCNSFVRIREITDGTANTLLVGERAFFTGAAIWPGVGGNRFEDDVLATCTLRINSSWGAFSSLHEGGSQFALADGSARFINEKIDSKLGLDPREMGTFQRLGAIGDGRTVGEF